jgi:hypothetical protein
VNLVIRNIILQRHIVCETMFVVVPWIQFSIYYTLFIVTTCFGLLWPSSDIYSFTHSPLFMSAVPPYTGQCLHTGSVLFMYVVFVLPLCYKMY